MKGMEMLRRSSVFAAEVMEVFDRSPTDKELVSQSKVLCRDYIHSRLHRAGIGWSKPEHGSGGTLAEVSSVLLWLGDELEYLRPNVYRNVARQLNITIASETIVSDAFLAVAAEIFSTDVEGVLAVMDRNIVLVGFKAGHPPAFLTHSETDITKCVVNTDPSFRSHWLVAAACACGHYFKAVVFYLLREK
ncbi:bcl-2-related ovarian killer protein homolog A-like [Sinocyclocheilus grahami]|uniref:bcl-2-related ovarian killer protein homolog A-like n=1 Tax=Sinocyclocheilus grahami TaxID=75366 RepID=UPI0007AD3C2F|nr:PREDICTED: bcl-2-related ovarian killer protein homolog A-like [Sinocyclocheilus grahami]